MPFKLLLQFPHSYIFCQHFMTDIGTVCTHTYIRISLISLTCQPTFNNIQAQLCYPRLLCLNFKFPLRVGAYINMRTHNCKLCLLTTHNYNWIVAYKHHYPIPTTYLLSNLMLTKMAHNLGIYIYTYIYTVPYKTEQAFRNSKAIRK